MSKKYTTIRLNININDLHIVMKKFPYVYNSGKMYFVRFFNSNIYSLASQNECD
jgi:hypothetical protein